MKNYIPKGGEFIIRSADAKDIFIPEEWNEEQIMMAETVIDFMVQEIHPILDDLDAMKDPNLMPDALEKAGQMGFSGISIPEEYGGLDLDFNTGLLFGEAVAPGFCFATTIGAQTSIGSLPIVFYGTEAQQQKYLPGIADASLKASYCLTEPSAGSDANSGKTKAVLSKDGKYYILNGQKMWITNGGFADIFIVFAKIEEDKNLSAFIVEKDFGGIELGAEEKKLGIKGSSTVQVFFNDCPVPVENLLSERGDGFKMALNILNTGRIKLAAGAIGGSKVSLDQGIKYAIKREQFGKSIGTFGAIQYKLAEMATRIFASESAIYRVGKAIDNKCDQLVESGTAKQEAKMLGVREYAIECAIMKVHGSEVLDYCVDETLQIFGGMGYSVETGVERGYRDARITRIYEGTNEINRMLSVGELFRKAFKTKELDIVSPVKKLPFYLFKQIFAGNGSGAFGKETKSVYNLKQVFLMLAAAAGKKFHLKLIDEQEIILNLSDILAESFVAQSVWLRIEKLKKAGNSDPKELEIKEKMAQVYLYQAVQRVNAVAKEAIDSFAEGGQRRMLLWSLKKLTRPYQVNPKELRRDIANYMMAQGGFPFTQFKVDVESVLATV